MGVPKGLVALLTDLCVSSCVYRHHAEEHDMTRNTRSCVVMYLDSTLIPKHVTLDVEEVHVVGGDMHDGPEKHAVSRVAMEPLRKCGTSDQDQRFTSRDGHGESQEAACLQTASIRMHETTIPLALRAGWLWCEIPDQALHRLFKPVLA